MYGVRPANAADAAALQHIYASCVGTAGWLPAAARARPDFALASRGESVHVACDANGAVIGFVSIYLPESFLHHLFVLPRRQGQGVGGSLLASLEAWLAPPWRLKCVRANRRAHAFYLAKGWRAIGWEESDQGPCALLEWRAGRE
ncbi:GNAT family N-acetyltransferase [Janthinobacterium sp.]|uniref:GNAT family N-acetyltransferase n=1 Tax=Janthinobacterium sp. TaxID=1871054 RepID=UPI00293D610C|nr:GNAT family N-acetyltransferase [Janthinobacterium sp.]